MFLPIKVKVMQGGEYLPALLYIQGEKLYTKMGRFDSLNDANR